MTRGWWAGGLCVAVLALAGPGCGFSDVDADAEAAGSVPKDVFRCLQRASLEPGFDTRFKRLDGYAGGYRVEVGEGRYPVVVTLFRSPRLAAAAARDVRAAVGRQRAKVVRGAVVSRERRRLPGRVVKSVRRCVNR